ncbi:betaine/proline/choline family ABC transporter ATP-binding protein [Gemmobacter denitrificans]|uniref:Quaternary amine transport ATP-binding protein n=1 Tax=Gemmobacter denitrificans TaxID=3123040 RepID=A0ABU8BU98_9RHOB
MAEPDETLICRELWKVFGAHAGAALSAAQGDADRLLAQGLVPAVRGVNLSVRRGEIFVIMGLSGSGKSTLVRLLSRLIEPTAGEVLFNGQNLLTASDAEMTRIRRHKMGMVFQHFALLPHLTVLENVAFPLAVQGVAADRRAERAREMVALVGLAGREGSYPRQLSGGQQQRVGIARSLAVEPELWFLDEPFSALDPLIRRELQDEFIRLQSRLHKTIVFITHDFDEAIRLADRIAIMKDGVVEQCDTPEALVLRPATEYVRAFTGAVPKAKVVRLARLMIPGPVAEGLALMPDRATVAEAGPAFLGGAEAIGITQDGLPVGTVSRRAVIDLLLGGGA